MDHRLWMYDMDYENVGGLKSQYLDGVRGFIDHAMSLDLFQKNGVVRCPCSSCRCLKFFQPDIVMTHLYRNGFKPRYFVWVDHGEIDGLNGIFYNSLLVDEYDMLVHGRHARAQHRVQHDRVQHGDRIYEMVNDAFGIGDGTEPEQNLKEDPNEEARGFYQQLEKASHPLCEGSLHSALSVAVRLMSIKSDWNIAQAAMDSMVGLLGELVNPELNIPQNFYQAKKLVSKLGLSYSRIHCCINGCMLFYKNDAELENCKFCGHGRYKWTPGGKMVSIKAMNYLPLIPRLKRLYASMKSSPHMKWHHENRRPLGILSSIKWRGLEAFR
ncbi:putative protein isoform X1 [Capsicum annuum]|uniref:uncharacterized protein LOC107841925 isoform X1 n=1 Tax=Capsicum annuum TaxID=4072 RepID=UPI001FB09CD1|nr:uncharacterized protein LOC107841925 isoform X1 [Capsicum annuum]XP_047252398.1 uncharacterized protein LOC107841925 isoform X1 [Capsicum annuum]XP_047252399.1 uncharacterized protein LOC107841925 isoform X1 [Capsicum annuum]XP_047252400.1 uncharacterized protein LOC107841925 isoform X1 [Capsicum annuum]XP_047252401.1 uncharacterized protein LOC107841925 isoform X1 [Capsicum annuum]XP_047252402.1 uncharacterized protein LOC107841925 isoform X1 [Capsicum annuum]XP_047252403.1 uncharacterize